MKKILAIVLAAVMLSATRLRHCREEGYIRCGYLPAGSATPSTYEQGLFRTL